MSSRPSEIRRNVLGDHAGKTAKWNAIREIHSGFGSTLASTILVKTRVACHDFPRLKRSLLDFSCGMDDVMMEEYLPVAGA